ncbi:MAG: autotransporter outer membrane beta-barrel domain-containing protein [Planctomycetota bacterium]|jgi:hypothetical protein
MKTTKTLTFLVVALGMVCSRAEISEAAPMGTAWTYQGRLMDANGPADGLYDLQFTLYDDANTIIGNKIGSDANWPDVDVIDGYFTVVLDFNDPNAFMGDSRWLEVVVRPGDSNDENDFVALIPRHEVTPTPYALYAKTSGADNDWVVSGSSMYSIPGKVGIGTTTPRASLEVTNTGGSHAIWASTSRIPVYALRTATSGTWPAVAGDCNSLVGGASGIRGRILSTSPGGLSAGVYGLNYGTGSNGVGVRGHHNGSGAGIHGKAAGNLGKGVYGEAAGDTGYGVFGTATGSSPGGTAYGGYLTGDNDGTGTSYGLYSRAIGTEGGNYGVYGYATGGASNYAIYGNVSGSPLSVKYAGYFVGGANYFQGDVGIGTTSPAAKLDIKATGDGAEVLRLSTDREWAFRQLGTGASTALELVSIGGGGNKNFVINTAGNVIVGNGGGILVSGGGKIDLMDENGNGPIISLDPTQGNRKITTPTLVITGGSDLSERFEVSAEDEQVKPGMVVCIDPQKPGDLVVSKTTYDRTVAGIVSGAGGVKPGMLMGQKGTKADGEHPVALTGRVYCWADASNGPIEPGDLLTTSNVLGHAMQVSDYAKAQGAILGKAMTSLESGKGLVLVLVSLQ